VDRKFKDGSNAKAISSLEVTEMLSPSSSSSSPSSSSTTSSSSSSYSSPPPSKSPS
jgi:hypothetical protein